MKKVITFYFPLNKRAEVIRKDPDFFFKTHTRSFELYRARDHVIQCFSNLSNLSPVKERHSYQPPLFKPPLKLSVTNDRNSYWTHTKVTFGYWFGCEIQCDDIILSVFFFFFCLYISNQSVFPPFFLYPSHHSSIPPSIHLSSHPFDAMLYWFYFPAGFLHVLEHFSWQVYVGLKLLMFEKYLLIHVNPLRIITLWPYLHNLPALTNLYFWKNRFVSLLLGQVTHNVMCQWGRKSSQRKVMSAPRSSLICHTQYWLSFKVS